jgi:ribonuclease T1
VGSTRRITVALVGLIALVLVGWVIRDQVVSADDVPGAGSGLEVTALSELPAEVAATWDLVESGGPFRYDEDGATFGNREGVLPDERAGYYREYTVPTPDSPDRGSRRLVTGAEDEVYYTADHYASFVVVDVSR